MPLSFEMRWTHQFQNCLSTNGKSCPMWSRKKLSQDHPVTQIQSEARLWWRFLGWRQKSWDELGTPACLWQMNFMGVFYCSGFPAPKHTSHPFVMNYWSVHLFSKHYWVPSLQSCTDFGKHRNEPESIPTLKKTATNAGIAILLHCVFSVTSYLISWPILSVATLGTEYC